MKTLSRSTRKTRGAHFTPPELARFLASRLREHRHAATGLRLRVFDPACGDGELLEAFRETCRNEPVELVGVETDPKTAEAARERLAV